MTEAKTLFSTKWLSLKQKDNYIFSHETRCSGGIVAVLPYRGTGRDREYLLRDEYNIAWGGMNISSITGGIELGERPEMTAVRELYEEAGLDIRGDKTRTVNLGECRCSKSNDAIYHLFAFDVSGIEQEEPKGDGSEDEKKSKNFWAKDLEGGIDSLLYVLWYRLMKEETK